MSQAACVVKKLIELPNYVTDYLTYEDQNENEPVIKHNSLGGIASNCKFSWLSNGPRFEVVHNGDQRLGMKLSAWTFGSVVKDPTTEVVCVVELPQQYRNTGLLIVGLNCELTGGMVCVFNVGGSKVLRAIEIGQKITSMYLVDGGLNLTAPLGPLQIFDGVLAVGTASGSLLMVDLCRQICDDLFFGRTNNVEAIRDEVCCCSLEIITYTDPSSLECYKVQALNHERHLAIQLNFEATAGLHFSLMGPKGEVRLNVNKEEVTISSLHYCPQLKSILVGFNFGAFQLWNLMTMRLEYTSPVFEENVPVSHFGLQEPSDDPKAYSYIWVVYSYTDPTPIGFPIAVLYSLVYETKEWQDDLGYFYEEFKSCSFRFQMELIPTSGCDLQQARGARCLSLRTITKTNGSKNELCQDVPDDSIAVCAVSWIVFGANRTTSHAYLSLFDLNQWYKEQMPNGVASGDESVNRYMSQLCLSELMRDNGAPDDSPVLDVTIDPATIRTFKGAQRLEEHYYPSSCAFECLVLRGKDVTRVECHGLQRALLIQLEKGSSLTLLRPSDFYEQSISIGLTPLFVDAPSNARNAPPLEEQREFLLNVALEQQLVTWLCRCAREWSNGSYASMGCTLDFVLRWAWQRSAVLKSNADALCVPLFDYSGVDLDYNSNDLLNNCVRQLNHLKTLYCSILSNCCSALSNPEQIDRQAESLGLVCSHLEVLRWLMNVGLLPECSSRSYPRRDENERLSAPYPAKSLTSFYSSRRIELNNLCGKSNASPKNESQNLLFIDNLIDFECGDGFLHNQWQLDGGSGLYPPPSLQALLRIYLLEGVPIVNKHRVLIYFFLDLAMALNDQAHYSSIITHLIKFPAVFQVSPSVIKITQAFWQLDHGDFDTAMEQLLDPLVKKQDLKIRHHRTIIDAMIKQNQHKHALIYVQVMRPPLHEFDDICTTISLYLANNMLNEGFNYLRQNRSSRNELQLLMHLFNECERTKNLLAVSHYTLSPFEEATFVNFLQSSNQERHKNLQVVYYVQRSRFVEAFEANEKLKTNETRKQGLIGQGLRDFRDALIDEVYNSMPDVSKTLLKHYKDQVPAIAQWKEVARPEPLSVFVHSSQSNARYKSSFIEASMAKAKETWSQPSMHDLPKNRHGFSPARSNAEDVPFLRTPNATAQRIKMASPVIYPTVIDPEEEDGQTPAKRFRLSARQSLSSMRDEPNETERTPLRGQSSALLNTPIVKRKLSAGFSLNATFDTNPVTIGTPQSILKVRNLVQCQRRSSSTSRGNTPTPEQLEDIDDDDDDDEEELPAVAVTPPTLSPRKSLVRFEGVTSQNSSIASGNDDDAGRKISDVVLDVSSKNSSRSTTSDVFYSPDVSLDTDVVAREDEAMDVDPSAPEIVRPASGTPKSRRSYKDLTPSPDSSPRHRVRSKTSCEIPDATPRKRNSSVLDIDSSTSVLSSTDTSIELTPVPKAVPKVSGRKSLSRQVLEQNTLAKAMRSIAPTPPQLKSPVTKVLESVTASAGKNLELKTSYSKTETSVLSQRAGELLERSTTTYNVTTENVFKTAHGPSTSEKTSTHVHNESSTIKTETKTVFNAAEEVENELRDEPSELNSTETLDVSGSSRMSSVLSSDSSESDVTQDIAPDVASPTPPDVIDVDQAESVLNSSEEHDVVQYETLSNVGAYEEVVVVPVGHSSTSDVNFLERNVFAASADRQQQDDAFECVETRSVSDTASEDTYEDLNVFERNVVDSRASNAPSSSNATDEDAVVDVEVYERVTERADDNSSDYYRPEAQRGDGNIINGHVSDEERVETESEYDDGERYSDDDDDDVEEEREEQHDVEIIELDDDNDSDRQSIEPDRDPMIAAEQMSSSSNEDDVDKASVLSNVDSGSDVHDVEENIYENVGIEGSIGLALGDSPQSADEEDDVADFEPTTSAYVAPGPACSKVHPTRRTTVAAPIADDDLPAVPQGASPVSNRSRSLDITDDLEKTHRKSLFMYDDSDASTDDLTANMTDILEKTGRRSLFLADETILQSASPEPPVVLTRGARKASTEKPVVAAVAAKKRSLRSASVDACGSPLPPMMVRRLRSASVDQAESDASPTSVGRRRLRSASVEAPEAAAPLSTSRRQGRSNSVASQDDNEPKKRGRPPKNATDVAVVVAKTRTKSRSSEGTTTTSSKKRLRSTGSEDDNDGVEPVAKPARKTQRRGSVTAELPTIDEETKTDSSKSSVQQSNIEKYTTARRMTRRQKMMMEKSITDERRVETYGDCDGVDDRRRRGPQLTEIDPIEMLLDKESFHGQPDPDEQKILSSPASSDRTESSMTTRSVTKLRKTRSNSEVSLPSSTSDFGSPPKRRQRVVTSAEVSPSAVPKKRNTRQRSNAQDSDVSDCSKVSAVSKSSKGSKASRTREKPQKSLTVLEKIVEEPTTSTARVTRSRRGSQQRSVTASPERLQASVVEAEGDKKVERRTKSFRKLYNPNAAYDDLL